MIPILYEADETEFKSYGIGALSSAISCLVTEERNSTYELVLKYPVTGNFYSEIKRERIIKAKPSDTGFAQAFRIYRITTPINGIIKVYAQHISYDLSYIAAPLWESDGEITPQLAIDYVFEHALYSHNFTFLTDYTEPKAFAIDTPKSLRAVLGGEEGSILNKWGGEFEWDNFKVIHHQGRGSNSGVVIEYGKNITDFEHDADNSGVYTDMLPYTIYTNKDEEEVVVTLPEGLISITDTQLTQRKTLIKDFTEFFEYGTEVTEDMLREKAESYLASNPLGTESPSITLSFEALWKQPEYSALLERVSLCDTVTVRYPLLGISEHLKVVKTVYNTLSETYESITLGTCKSNLLNTISEVSVTAEEASSKTDKFTAAMNAAIENATERVTGQKGGYVVLHGDDIGLPYELLVMDNPAIDDAVSVWRWNVSGLAYSETGYNGPYETAITADGAIVADFITSGKLTANIIKAGTITSMDGSSYWNIETGEVHLSAYAAVSDLQDVESRVLGISSTINVLQTGVEGVTENVSSLVQSIEGISAKVSENGKNISSLTLTVNGFDTRISDAEGNIATLTQTAKSLKAEVAGKVDEENNNSSFGWELLSTGFVLRSDGKVVMSSSSSGLSITGHVAAQTGSLGDMEIQGTLRFAGNEDYYISGKADGNGYFVYLPGLSINEDGAKFTGYVVASSGKIGGFSIGASYLYSSKKAYNSSDKGVYLGTDGIGLGAGTFYVTKEGELYASKATISGTIDATGGTIGGFVIGSSALTNNNGGSTIRILDDKYTTELCASVIQCVNDSDSSDAGYVGWSVSKKHIYIQAVNSSTHSGVEILPYYTKRNGTGSKNVYEGCITSVSAESFNADSSVTTGSTTPFILGAYRKYNKSPYVSRNEWGAFLRFANFNRAELVRDSTLGGGWYVRDEADGISYPLSEVIPFLYKYLYSDNAYAAKARTFTYVRQTALPTTSNMSSSGVSLTVYVATICFGKYYLHCGRTSAAVKSDAWIYYNDTTTIAAWISPSEVSSINGTPTPVCGAYIAPSSSFEVYSGTVYKGRPVWLIDTNTADAGTFLFWISTNA